jgi:hypothetical protein
VRRQSHDARFVPPPENGHKLHQRLFASQPEAPRRFGAQYRRASPGLPLLSHGFPISATLCRKLCRNLSAAAANAVAKPAAAPYLEETPRDSKGPLP